VLGRHPRRNGQQQEGNKQNAKKPQRARTMKWTIDDAFFYYDKQLEVLRRLIADDPALEERNFFKKEMKVKLDGYAKQDVENGVHDLSAFISLDATIELLLIGKLKCAYCRQCCDANVLIEMHFHFWFDIWFDIWMKKVMEVVMIWFDIWFDIGAGFRATALRHCLCSMESNS
jgi:hypothetical protein